MDYLFAKGLESQVFVEWYYTATEAYFWTDPIRFPLLLRALPVAKMCVWPFLRASCFWNLSNSSSSCTRSIASGVKFMRRICKQQVFRRLSDKCAIHRKRCRKSVLHAGHTPSESTNLRMSMRAACLTLACCCKAFEVVKRHLFDDQMHC